MKNRQPTMENRSRTPTGRLPACRALARGAGRSVVGFAFYIENGAHMLLVGLTGGIGVGKSTVAAMFAARGAAVVDGDEISRRLQEPGQPCHRAIVDAFGAEILDPAGRIDRRQLGAVVFADTAGRRRLEAIMHPAIWAACDDEVRAA